MLYCRYYYLCCRNRRHNSRCNSHDMWRLLYKSINIHNGVICVYFWNDNVVYVARDVDYHTTMGAILAPIVFVCNTHSKQNKVRNDSDNCSDKCLTNKID